jgi:hypothetical protein
MDTKSHEQLVSQIEVMLAQVENAHGRYEAVDLGGKRDEQWPEWYADYLVEHGFLELFPAGDVRTRIASRLDGLLSELNTRQQAEAPSEQWTTYYAAYLAGLAN